MQILRTKSIFKASIIVLFITAFSANSGLYALEKFSVAGWSKPISEITNLLAEPDKGFFKAK